MLDDFENSAIVYPQALSELNKSAETKEHEDRPYQLEAVEALVEGLDSHDRGQLIMACGTGKTFVTLWIKEIKATNLSCSFAVVEPFVANTS